ncbi:MAG: FAD-binding protein, partial [Bacteroidales bacterium]|nr:FAD-binding protein [Candidatus Colimorpha onthohippi]
NKRGNIADVINLFIEHGANPTIAIDSHAHIGTDKLSGIIKNMRSTIERYGGEYHFGSQVVDLLMREGRVVGVRDARGLTYEGKAVVLATGHSARDIYSLFFNKGWLLEPKPFALGVRVEHPQRLINSIQYHSEHYSPYLPPAAYSLATQVNGHGVFSFCMCPGGVIVPAATDYGQQVVNGMSASARSSAFANSGIAVTVSQADVVGYEQYGPLALMYFQQQVEQVMWRSVGQSLSAPAQRLTDFCDGKMSRSLPRINYMGQVVPTPLHQLLPPFVAQSLRQGFRQFDQKMRGFYTSEASILAVESRTSSPVRIPRMDDMQHPQLPGLYPCGEGAGYAGGIVSSAMDGINCVNHIVNQ